MLPFAPPTPSANPDLDGEHRVQVALINALCAAVEDRATSEEIGSILERLVDYSKAHFLSEELLMRLDSYDGFDEHVEDHADMLDSLAAMVDTHRVGRTELIPGQARRMLAFLVRHIETRDASYANAAHY
ncbi:hemerythrin family protein [Accumulibacter sp.]|uniref:Hemerythrin family protein n=1 Tax=Candidatus Accumulibacter proximus TaxID=2954385 RepID=A0A935UGN0_9PROT|nr:hemerythrin family protein [Accumulibacter sp.]MBK7676236.1 hemerythrin family protein [Candidatus Accumulibacter proximus]MBL8373628.1 hemerythrin family protein [Accumulibacter sp.]